MDKPIFDDLYAVLASRVRGQNTGTMLSYQDVENKNLKTYGVRLDEDAFNTMGDIKMHLWKRFGRCLSLHRRARKQRVKIFS